MMMRWRSRWRAARRDDRRHFARDVVQPREEILRLPVAGRFDERRVLRRVVGHQQHRVDLEPVDEEAAVVVERRIDRSAQMAPAARRRPSLRGLEQRAARLRVGGLEEAEHAHIVVVRVVVPPIVDGADTADDDAGAPGEKQLDVRMREERVLGRIQPLALADPEGWHPVRIVRVALVCVIDEACKIPASLDGRDDDRLGHADIMVYACGSPSASRSRTSSTWPSPRGYAPSVARDGSA
jgi:hypothetical protein